MYAFGDESGHLRTLLDADDEVFVVAVVAGDRHECGSCSKRVLRRADDVSEVKWRNLSPSQKRRVVDCLAEPDRSMATGYVSLERSDLDGLPNSYLLYQNRAFDVDWDLAVTGRAYAVLLEELVTEPGTASKFTFDRLFGAAQSEAIGRAVDEHGPDLAVSHGSSHGTRGIQTADCVAGAVAEAARGNGKWLDALRERDLYRGTGQLLSMLESELSGAE